VADINLRAEPPRPALHEDRLIVELPLAGPVSKEWLACFTALARADDVPAEVKDPAKNPKIAVTVAPGLEPADMKATMDAARAVASKADAREAAAAQWWQELRTNGSALKYSLVRPALPKPDLRTVAPYMFWLMFRNVASAGLVFEDPVHHGVDPRRRDRGHRTGRRATP
jgi:hypothetical protein